MADPQSTGNVDQLVDAILNNTRFQSLLRQRESTSQAVGETISPPSSTGSSISTATTTTTRTHDSPQSEFCSIFRRGSSTATSNTAPPFFTSSPSAGRGRGIFVSTARRSSFTSTPSRHARGRGRHSPTAQSPAGLSGPSAIRSSLGRSRLFCREVILLSCADSSEVIKGHEKAELARRGQVLSAFDFNKLWTDTEVISHLTEAFGAKLQHINQTPKITILQAYRNELVEPNLTSGQTLNGDRLCRLFPQKAVWCRPASDLRLESEEPAVPVIEIDDPVDSFTEDVPTKQESLSSEDVVAQFIDMFPNLPPEEVTVTVQENRTLCGSILFDKILNILTRRSDEETSGNATLDVFRRKVLPTDIIININRLEEDLLMEILRRYKSRCLDLLSKPVIKFSNEPGQDEGGVRAEFFNMGFAAMKSGHFEGMPLFEGQEGHLLPAANRILQMNGVFQVVGKFIAHSILHECGGFNGMARPVVEAIVSSLDAEDLATNPPIMSVEDLPDYDLREIIKTLDSEEELNLATTTSVLPYLEESGFLLVVTNQNRKQVIHHLMMFFVLEKRFGQIKDIRKGLNEISLAQFLKVNRLPCNISEVFPSGHVQLSATGLLQRTDFSSEVSQASKYYFETFLHDLENRNIDGYSVADFVIFCSGRQDLSSSDRLQVEQQMEKDALPTASTCFLEIKIPHVDSYEIFKTLMLKALQFSQRGFGLL